MTSSPSCWWTKTKDLSFASSVCPPEVVHFSMVIGISRGRLKTSYYGHIAIRGFFTEQTIKELLAASMFD